VQLDTCILCGQKSKITGEPKICQVCNYVAEPIKELWSLLNSELGTLASVDCETQETARFIADLMALGVDHPRIKHLARLCSTMINLVWEKDSEGSIFEIEKEIGTTFDITSRLELMAHLGLISKEGDMVKVPPDSMIKKIALPMRERINEQYRLRTSLFLLGYLTIGTLASFYETSDATPVKKLLGSNDNLDRLPRAFISSLTYVLLQWYDGWDQFYGSDLRKRLRSSRIQGAARSDIFGVLAGRDPRRAVTFIKAIWKGFDQIFIFDDYVKRIRERIRERERPRGGQ
jgi:hypothetical protein